jgi:thioesterase domain-containing protein
MAHDYLAEIRAVQPRGPYLIGGFSGGGIAAYEMARQLIAAGEHVPLLVLLDTPLPHDDPLTLGERLAIHKQNLERAGMRHALDWARVKLSTLRTSGAEAHAAPPYDPANFRSRLIEAAFYRAQLRYDIRPVPVQILLCRPRLQPTHVFASGRAINRDRRRIYHDNGWTPFARRVEVFETPGDHDSMVLEPNVRILAAHLRPALELAERSAKQRPRQELTDASAERYAS